MSPNFLSNTPSSQSLDSRVISPGATWRWACGELQRARGADHLLPHGGGAHYPPPTPPYAQRRPPHARASGGAQWDGRVCLGALPSPAPRDVASLAHMFAWHVDLPSLNSPAHTSLPHLIFAHVTLLSQLTTAHLPSLTPLASIPVSSFCQSSLTSLQNLM